MKTGGHIPGSFRDPSGFIFWQDGAIYRQVNTAYKENYDHLINSGLYRSLVDSGLLIPHEEVDMAHASSDQAYKVIKPETLPFVSYPYEWCFSQLKAAALATLRIQKKALDFGMSLKDCSAYNIQFRNNKPVLIDSLSFEKYREGEPWVAYRQCCQHFLAPLAVMCYRDIRLSQLLRAYVDGLPLDLAGSLLPLRTRFRFSLLTHIHLHAKSQAYFAGKIVDRRAHQMGRQAFMGLIDNLESAIEKLQWQPKSTAWAGYYEATHYSPEARAHKKQLVAEFLERSRPKMIWDLGANLGLFSRFAGERGIQTIAFDSDPACVEKNYLECARKGETNVLPLWLDLANPSPGLGWENEERNSLLERGPADAALALALIHHLAIANSLPLHKIAGFFGKICLSLIIEFVPKNDLQVRKLLSTRDDIFPDYTQEIFEQEFGKIFTIQCAARIKDSERTLYLMEKKTEKIHKSNA
jgi:hypothetical protein